MAPAEDNDSGMESQEPSQCQDISPEKKLEIEADYENEPDETLGERLWGLTEMFPDWVRNATHSTVIGTKYGIKSLYSFSRSALWVVVSSSIVIFAPVILEVERAQMEEAQRNQQKQMLLGPNTALSGGGVPPIMPPRQ